LYDVLLGQPVFCEMARLVFYHHRGVLSRDLWTEWLRLRAADSSA
jgi:hypothetical protein